MSKYKTRRIKQEEYKQKYSEIPIDFQERLEWMYDKYNISDRKAQEIIFKKHDMINSLYYNDIVIKLFEDPEGTPRPRFRLVNRKNFVNQALNNGSFVHVYQPCAKDDSIFMKRLVGEDLVKLNQLIYTPCIVTYDAYIKTPQSYSIVDTFLSEIGLIRPLKKPDFDNIGKKYSDMMNSNVWIDDSLVISGTVNKYYSILPRIEIRIQYLNMLYNKYQYNSISKHIQEAEYYGNKH